LGLSQAVILETSPWIKLSEMPVEDSTRAAILAGAQRHLKFSKTASDINPYGRLAGMTNHTAALRNRCQSRFVTALAAESVVAEIGKKPIASIEASYTRATATTAKKSNEPNERQIVDRNVNRERGPSR
jgi:hypothetical protein